MSRASKDTLTERQSDCLVFVRGFIRGKGYSPTLREISAGLGLKSVSPVQGLLEQLAKKGHLTWVRGALRSITLLNEITVITPQEWSSLQAEVEATEALINLLTKRLLEIKEVS